MENENKNLILILLVLALFTGVTIEVGEGSPTVGIVLFIVFMFLLTKINFKHQDNVRSLKKSKLYFSAGVFLIFADLYYNFKTGGKFWTLDIMTLFLGASLIGTQLPNLQTERISRFGMYISSVFIFLFLIFYTMFTFFDIDFIHKFDHYLILLPTVGMLSLMGIPLEVIATETVRISGIEEMTILIGGPCSGLYSMFLLIGIVYGYSRIEKIEAKKAVIILGFCVTVAYISNLFRVIILYLTAYYYGREMMMLVHAHLGWIIFAAVAAGIMYFIELKK